MPIMTAEAEVSLLLKCGTVDASTTKTAHKSQSLSEECASPSPCKDVILPMCVLGFGKNPRDGYSVSPQCRKSSQILVHSQPQLTEKLRECESAIGTAFLVSLQWPERSL